MRFKEFIYLFIKSLNPMGYKSLATRRKRETFRYFFNLILISMIIGILINVPNILSMPEQVTSTLSKFDKFKISIDVSTNESVQVLRRPKTVLDMTGNRTELGKDTIVITQEEVMWRKFKPSLFGLKLFRTEKREITEFSNVFTKQENFTKIYWILLLLIAPTLLVLIYIFTAFKYGLLILLATIIGFVVFNVNKRIVKPFTVFRIAVFSITPMVVLEVGFNVFNFSVVPLLLYVFIFILGLILVTEK